MGIPRRGAHPPGDCLVETLQAFTTPNREFPRAYAEKFQQLADAARARVAEVRPEDLHGCEAIKARLRLVAAQTGEAFERRGRMKAGSLHSTRTHRAIRRVLASRAAKALSDN